jgi:hypothetical protein
LSKADTADTAGLPFWNFDMRFAKTTAIKER